MKFLVSVIDEQESLDAYHAGADIIDIKNPREGSLGANFPITILKIRELLPEAEISAAIGDMPNLPGTASLAALGASVCGVNYVKVGLYGVKNELEAKYFLKNVVNSVKIINKNTKIVAASYADYKIINSLDPLLLVNIAKEVDIDGVMIDVRNKNNGNLFELMPEDQIKNFIQIAKTNGLLTALAGSLGKKHILKVFELGADVFAVRGSVCSGDRSSRLDKNKVKDLADQIKRIQYTKPQIKIYT
jgi:uncharacterized protein (UPF0264 family)